MNRLKSLLLLPLAILMACESETHNPVANYEIVQPDWHFGEYLQARDSDSVVSVNRTSGPSQGLISYSLSNKKAEVLDGSAVEARDIFVRQNRVVYREKQSLKIWSQGRVRDIAVSSVQKIRAFFWDNDVGTIFLDHPDSLAEEIHIRDDGTIRSSIRFSGSVRAYWRGNSGKEYLIYRDARGLALSIRKHPSTDWKSPLYIENGEAGEYVTVREIENVTYIAYQHQENGVLKIAEFRQPDASDLKTSVVDGIQDRTHRGLDIAIFNDRGNPGLVYLDGWELKLRWARFNSSQKTWRSEFLPFQGAVGFYTQVLSEDTRHVRIAFHNFRTQGAVGTQTFEDLAFADLLL